MRIKRFAASLAIGIALAGAVARAQRPPLFVPDCYLVWLDGQMHGERYRFVRRAMAESAGWYVFTVFPRSGPIPSGICRGQSTWG